MTKVEYLLEWMQSRLGNPYIYGATQKDCTPTYRKERIEQYPKYKDSIKRNCQVLNGSKNNCAECKWYDNTNNIPKKAYDCAIYSVGEHEQLELPMLFLVLPLSGRSDIWAEKGKFSPHKLCSFSDSLGTKQHVGWYNGYAYPCSGT